MGIGQKLKETLHGDHSDRKHYNDSSTPGSFPSDNGSGAGRHTDGTRYHAPTGTAVEGTGTTDMAGRSEGTFTGGHGTPGHDSSGAGMSSSERRIDDRNVMDPADTKHGSNVMSSTGAAGDPISSSSTGDRYNGERSTGDHHNKLHKRDDPRRYDDNVLGAGVGGGTGGLASSQIPERHHQSGQHSTGYGRDTAGFNRDTTDHGRDTTGYGRDAIGSYDNGPQSSSSTTDRGHGVYNTITGTGSREDGRPSHHQGHHDGRNVPGDTATSIGDRKHQGQGNVQHERDMQDPRTTGTGAGIHQGRHEGRHHGEDTFDSRSTGTGIGSGHMAYRPQDTTSIGTSSDRREHIGPSGDSRVLSNSHGGPGLAGAGTSAGAARMAAHEAGKHHNGQQGQYGDVTRSTYENLGHSSGQRGYDTGNTNTAGTQSSDNDSRNTTGSAGQGYDHNHTQGHGFGQGHQGHQGRDQDRAVESIRSQVQERGVPAGMGSNTGAGQTSGSHFGQSSVGKSVGQGTGSGGAESGHFKTPHEGAKVLHQCVHCGQDNDISQYFKKEVVYRLGQYSQESYGRSGNACLARDLNSHARVLST